MKSTILFDENNLASSSFRASVEPKSLNTGNKLRDHDLQKEKYLNTESYHLISFQSEKIEKSGTAYKAIGKLVIKGVTRPVEIIFHFSDKGNTGVFQGNFSILRKDFEIGGGGLIGNTINIDLEVPVTK